MSSRKSYSARSTATRSASKLPVAVKSATLLLAAVAAPRRPTTAISTRSVNGRAGSFPTLSCYEAIGSNPEGKVAACGSGPGGPGSSCSDSWDCAPDLACRQDTHTCGPCQSHADCETGSSSVYACQPDGRCAYADCT